MGQVGGTTELICGLDLWDGCVLRREVVPLADGVCGLCGKAHTGGIVSVVYRNSKLPPVCDGGDGIDFRVAAR